ncbi:MAG: ADP-ribosylglycohydrolase family protein [Pseudomonadota bacterium]
MKRPIPNSYWVEPGRLLAGEHPAGKDLADTRRRIVALLESGVRSFIDLTEMGEMESYQSLLPAGVGYESFGLPDHSVPATAQKMRDVLTALWRELSTRPGVYVHCRAGIGRTGIAVGCYLRELGEPGDAALAELNRLWQQNARAATWPQVPETPKQTQFIHAWKPRRVRRRAPGERGGARLTLDVSHRVRGCLVGLAAGDIHGSGVAVAGKSTGWTDETAMTMCVAESLIANKGFNGRDQLDRYRAWAQDPAAAGAQPDAELRAVVRDALSRAAWGRNALAGTHDPKQNDASPLARCAAVALYARDDLRLASSLGADVARVTHQAPLLVDACRLFTCMIAAAIGGQTREQVLAVAQEMKGMPLKDEVTRLAAGWSHAPDPAHRPPAGILRVLDRVAREFARGEGFAQGLARLMAGRATDRDATCAAYGALAGAALGEQAIGPPLADCMARRPELEALAERLYRRH